MSLPPPESASLLASVRAALDAMCPGLRGDGGDVEVLAVDDEGVVSLRIVGVHASCPMALATLQGALEEALRAKVPAVTRVVIDR